MKKAVLLIAAIMSLSLALVPAHAATTNVVVVGYQYVPSGYVAPNPLNLPGLPGPQAIAPAAPVVHAGDTLKFMNLDAVSHTVSKESGPALGIWASKQLSAGGSAELSTTGFPAGTYIYKCGFHAGMRGSFVVQ